MPTVQELYELWAGDSKLPEELTGSLEPRSTESLVDAFAALGPKPGQLLADVGARDAGYAIRLAQLHGLRAVAIDPMPFHCELARRAVAAANAEDSVTVIEGAIEELPLEDGSVDWVWCRDVLIHVDARRGFAECARVLKPGGTMLAYVTLATDRLEPREARELIEASAIQKESFHADSLEAAARDAGLVLRSVDAIGPEWRERMIEDGTWDAAADVVQLGRLLRQAEALADRHGRQAVTVEWASLVWGLYQMLGKLRPTVYVWERDA
jgi:SAM-dependent methyltransferase